MYLLDTGVVFELRKAKVPATLREYLTLIEAMDKNVPDFSVENFYYLARTALVKDERNLDKFDRVFGQCFNGLSFVGAGEAGRATSRRACRLLHRLSRARSITPRTMSSARPSRPPWRRCLKSTPRSSCCARWRA